MRLSLALLFLLGASGCAYYNGLYNARGLVKRAESAAREGRDSAAASAWREAAAKADTVIARYPRSRWTDDALLTSGTSAALSGACEHGLARLAQWERHPAANARQKPRASIARGACLVRLGDYAGALDTLMPFTTYRDATLSRIAAAWAARAALARSFDGVYRLAQTAASDALDAELAMSALESGRSAVAVRILKQRASEWRSLSTLHGPLTLLARLDRAVADSIVHLTQTGRATRLERARLSLAAGLWSESAGDMTAARGHYDRALRMSADTGLVAEVVARGGLLEVRSAVTLDDARTRLNDARGKTTDAARRMVGVDSALQLAARLTEASDSSGASLFLAAEVVRDQVGAVPLARALFLRTAREHPRSSLAPRALLAAANLTPDSARVWRETVVEMYGSSPYAHSLSGKPVSPTALDADERLLHQTWMRVRSGGDSASVAAERRRP